MHLFEREIRGDYGRKKMSDLVKIIIRQTEILFKNLNAQIERCNLDAEIDGIQNARYLFHAIH